MSEKATSPEQEELEQPVTVSSDKGKGKAVEGANVEDGSGSSSGSDSGEEEEAETDEPIWHTDEAGTSAISTAAATSKGPPKNGDWEAIWSAQSVSVSLSGLSSDWKTDTMPTISITARRT